jgi:hypothetical protein
MFTTSKHHPNGGAISHCDNAKLEAAISRYQVGDAASLGEIIQLVEPRIRTLVRFHKTHHYRPEDELLSDVNFKLMRSIGRFDARRATGFAYVSKIIDSSLKTAVSNQRRNWSRHCELNDELVNTLPAQTDDNSALDDLRDRIHAEAKTTLVDPLEIAAQQWFLESFIADGFDARRHECADACMAVFTGITHAKSREIHDLSRLELRQLLYDDIKRREQISPGQLYGTRCAWMAQYSPLLSGAEFTKFVVLMKNLAPYLLLIVDPANRSHRRDRSPTIGRRNLEMILYGCPGAVPLFE